MNKKIYGIIYVIKNKVNNKLYIGQTNKEKGFNGRYTNRGEGIERVYNSHLSNKNNDRYYNVHLLNSIEKYGFNAFEVDEEFDIAYSQEELNKLEYMYIEIYKTRNPKYGYNYRYGGNNGKLSEETKRKLSEINKGKHLSEEHKQKIGEASKGRKHTEETKQYLREINSGENNPMYGKCGELHHNYGKPISEEQKIKISETLKGRKHTQEELIKMKESHLGKHHTEETKQKMSESHRGGKHYKAKPVYCYEKDDIRLSGIEWSRELVINKTGIQRCCRGEKEEVKGYHFRYATEEEIREYKLKHNIEK